MSSGPIQKEVWTSSRLKAYQTCPYKEILRYRMELAPIKRRSSLAFGTAIHRGLETGSIDEALNVLITDYPQDQEEADEQDIATVTVRALLEGYFKRYEPFMTHAPEYEFRMPMKAYRRLSNKLEIAGKIDDIAYIDGRWWIVEYKTASRIESSYFDRLYLDSQISMYIYAAQNRGYNPAGVIYRVIRKPSIRKGQKESLEGFLERLQKDIENRPEFYYTEQKLYRSKDDLKEFEQMLYYEAKQEANLFKTGKVIRHSTACSMYGACEYLPICMGEAGALEALYEHRKPNEELTLGRYDND